LLVGGYSLKFHVDSLLQSLGDIFGQLI